MDRGAERGRRVRLTGVTTLISRSAGIGASLVSIPVTARYLGAERFGLWLLLGSFLTWVSLVDLGLGNTLTTELARADGRDDRESPRVLVSSAFFPVLSIALATGVLFALVHPWVPWARLLNVSGQGAVSEAGPAIAVVAAVFVARLPLGIAARIYSAYQEGYRYQLWSGIGTVLSVLALLAGMAARVSLPALLAAFYGTALIGDAAATVEAFLLRRRWLAPDLRQFHRRVARSLLSAGLMFWAAQIAAILLLQTDLVVVARLFGVEAVADYGVALRLVGMVSMVQMAFASSLWPAYAEAIARKDLAWVRRSFARSLTLSVAWAVSASVGLVLLGGWAVRVLVAGKAAPSVGLLAALASTAVVSAVGQSFAMLLNGMGEIRIQAWLGLLSGIFNLAVSVLLGRLLGLPGVALGTTLAILASLGISGNFLRERLGAIRSALPVTVEEQ